jgi:hypothetical protein
MLIKILLDIILIVLIIYSKVSPYRDLLSIDNKNRFQFLEKIISPIFAKLNILVKPVQIGNGIYLDRSHILLMIFLILIITLL